MAVFAEFHVPSAAFVLGRSLPALPDTVVEIERVVASGALLTPYFWVTTADQAAFEARVADDPSIEDLHRVDDFDGRTLYRATWTTNVEPLRFAYSEVGAAITEATGTGDTWELRIRFEDQSELSKFRAFCEDEGVEYDLHRRYEAARVGKGAEYGLTPKQNEAATTAWEMGYFDSPREVGLADVAAELGVSTQAVSDRLRRAQRNLLAETLTVASPSTADASGSGA